ncbi:MAG TPA: hypothetical protein VF841_15950 [Anaeromyxobacter sp.]
MILGGALLAVCGALVAGIAGPPHPGWRRAGAAAVVAGLALSALGAVVALVESM